MAVERREKLGITRKGAICPLAVHEKPDAAGHGLRIGPLLVRVACSQKRQQAEPCHAVVALGPHTMAMMPRHRSLLTTSVAGGIPSSIG